MCNQIAKRVRGALMLCGLLALAACGGSIPGGDHFLLVPATYTIGGSITGMTGSGLVLADNGVASSNISYPASGSYPSLFGQYLNGTTYDVTVVTQPSHPSQTCVVANGVGTINGANVTNVDITCTTHASAAAVAHAITVDPQGKLVFVAHTDAAATGSDVAAFTIGVGTGALAAVSPTRPVAAAGSARPVTAVDPRGRFLYVAGNDTDAIAAFAIDTATGALAAIPGGSVAADAHGISSLVIDPTGSFLYAGAAGIVAFTIDAKSGALTPMRGSPFGAACPTSVAVEPSGQFLYAVDACGSGVISAYAVDPTLGVLTALRGSPFAGHGGSSTEAAR